MYDVVLQTKTIYNTCLCHTFMYPEKEEDDFLDFMEGYLEDDSDTEEAFVSNFIFTGIKLRIAK